MKNATKFFLDNMLRMVTKRKDGEKMADRYKLGDIDNEQFYMLPKGLFTNPQYKGLSNTARIVYAILKDRMKLSMKEGWHDENGEVYINFTQETLAQFLNVTPRAVKQVMAALKDVGLISTKRQGLGLPNKIYIHKLLPLPLRDEINCPSEVKSDSPIMGNELPPINTDNSNTKNSDTNMGAKPHKPRKQFIPPTLEEVEAHINEKGFHFNAKEFIDYYEASDWHKKDGKKVSNWRQCCVTWESNAKKHGETNKVSNSASPSGIRTNVDWGAYDGL